MLSYSKNINESNITERLGKLETSMIKEIGDFKSDFARTLSNDFTALNERIEMRLNLISDRVNERLDENGEPLLLFDKDVNKYYFLDKNHNKSYFPSSAG